MPSRSQSRIVCVHVPDPEDDYAWAECGLCGNTVKFSRQTGWTVCPNCGANWEIDPNQPELATTDAVE